MEFQIAEVVELVGGLLVSGQKDRVLSGVRTLSEADEADLSFFSHPKYRSQFDATRAGAVLVTPDIQSGPAGVALIQVDNPSHALAALVEKVEQRRRAFEPGVRQGAHVSEFADVSAGAAVHAGAVIEDGATIGRGSEIRSGAVISRDVSIGEDCIIHHNVSVREGCILGDRVILQPGAVIGSDGFGYEFVNGRHHKVPQLGIVVLESDVEVGANACIDRARFGQTTVGEGTKIDNLVQVGHNVEIGKNCILVALSGVAGSSKLGEKVTLAAQVGINGHIEIADGVQLGGKSGAMQSIDEPGVYMGTPAKPFKEEVRQWRDLTKLTEMRRALKVLCEEVDRLKKV
ncbi:MAG TPA: UDP-3-O-(3-hydroxymyristoyl)glucosamine N-acyltransferase [Verrucomicrobiales bacterium]|nr:UDP-3-O-(3-hydroxymyristoyl)glucosamine N-acyltransferase [Verrucomicrobiales bacterium]